MRRRLFPILLAMVLISIPISTVGATSDYTVTYTPESYIQFMKGSDTPGYVSPPNVANEFVGLLGTMVLTVNDPPATLIHPSILYTNGTTYFQFSGLRANPTPSASSFGFYIEIVTYINSSATPSYREPMTQEFVFLTDQTISSNISSLKVEFYFVSWEDSSVFIPGEHYELYQGTIGNFNLAVSSEENIWNDTDYILLEGQTIDPITNEPSNPMPIVGGGPTSTLPDTVPYVDESHPPQVLQYLLSIIDEQTIELSDAYWPDRTVVAKAKIDLINATPGTNYKVDIKFDSNSVNLGKFHLHLDGDLNQYGIPYSLYFKQDIVVPGENIRWNQILNYPEQTIKLTGVIQDDVERAPAGTYRDTITVTITAVD